MIVSGLPLLPIACSCTFAPTGIVGRSHHEDFQSVYNEQYNNCKFISRNEYRKILAGMQHLKPLEAFRTLLLLAMLCATACEKVPPLPSSMLNVL